MWINLVCMKTTESKPVGRPPKFSDPETFDMLVDLYQASRLSMEKPMNIVDFALFVGFSSKSQVYTYRSDPRFKESVERALAIIEEGHVDRVNRGAADRGNIFLLKASYGYEDKQVVEVQPMTVHIHGKDADL